MTGTSSTENLADDPLEVVRQFRKAARVIGRGEDRPRLDRLRALMLLAEEARRTDGTGFAQATIWAESSSFIRTGDAKPTVPSHDDPVAAACRRQLVQGRVRCESCKRVLPTAEELDRWARESRRELERAEIFEQAGA